jgi:hypothetical protein
MTDTIVRPTRDLRGAICQHSMMGSAHPTC